MSGPPDTSSHRGRVRPRFGEGSEGARPVPGSGVARFRADPALVRVGLMPMSAAGVYRAEVTERSPNARPIYWATAPTPRGAIMKALRHAARAKLPGVDLEMDRTYAHPFGPEGKAARLEQDSGS